jgi:hypothetical protein
MEVLSVKAYAFCCDDSEKHNTAGRYSPVSHRGGLGTCFLCIEQSGATVNNMKQT